MQTVRTDRSKEQASYFVSWSEYGTRYRLFVTPLAGFNPSVREEIGVSPAAALVTLWWGKAERPGMPVASSAIFNAGGGVLTDSYVGEKLGLQGEDLAAVANALRLVLVREGRPTPAPVPA